MKAVIFLPAYNEEQTIVEVLRSLPAAIPGIDAVERLVIDDGSTDHTAELARDEGARVVLHGENQGVGGAFQTAVEQALWMGAEILVTIDADGQFDPDQIPELVAPIVEGHADLVTGNRFSEGRRPEKMPRVKYRGNLAVASLLKIFAGIRLADVSCGFRAYSREALLNLNLIGQFTYTQETILDLSFKGLRIRSVPVSVRYFGDRRSRVAGSILTYAVNASKIIARTIRDFRPLRFFGAVGAVVFLIGLAFDLWLLGFFLQTGSFSPFKAVGFLGATLNVTGILLGGLGLLADMLYRIRTNQERILYYHKKNVFDGNRRSGPPTEA